MAENIREEIRRLNKRKQLSFGNSHAVELMQDSESSGSEMGAESPRRPDTPPAALKNPEQAFFTFKQVCWRRPSAELFNYRESFIPGPDDLRSHAEGTRREVARTVRSSSQQQASRAVRCIRQIHLRSDSETL